ALGARSRVQIENCSRIERTVAEKFKNRAVELIRSGLGYSGYLRAGPLSIFSRVRARQDVEFTDSVDSQQVSADATRSVRKLAGARIFNAIQQEDVLERSPPCNRECIALTRYGSGTLVCIVDRSWV